MLGGIGVQESGTVEPARSTLAEEGTSGDMGGVAACGYTRILKLKR